MDRAEHKGPGDGTAARRPEDRYWHRSERAGLHTAASLEAGAEPASEILRGARVCYGELDRPVERGDGMRRRPSSCRARIECSWRERGDGGGRRRVVAAMPRSRGIAWCGCFGCRGLAGGRRLSLSVHAASLMHGRGKVDSAWPGCSQQAGLDDSTRVDRSAHVAALFVEAFADGTAGALDVVLAGCAGCWAA